MCAAQACAALACLAVTAAWAGGWWLDPVIGPASRPGRPGNAPDHGAVTITLVDLPVLHAWFDPQQNVARNYAKDH